MAKATVAANSLEQTIRQRLLDFFHPLKGGQDGNGWDFGGTVYFSTPIARFSQSMAWSALRAI